jgi:hypothetical protein
MPERAFDRHAAFGDSISSAAEEEIWRDTMS